MSATRRRPDAFDWWIDAVGGFLTYTKDRVQIGSIGNAKNDIAIQADISRQHAEFLRQAQGTVLIAYAETTVNERQGTSFLLKDGDRIRMRTVEFVYHQPLEWSKTARLELVSRHRLPKGLDGVMLLSETCSIGGPKAQIPAPWEAPVVVSWNRDQYWLRAPGEMIIDGAKYAGWGPLSSTAKVKGEWGSFRWEPHSLASKASKTG